MTDSEAHEHILEPLAELPVALEVALAYVEQVKKRAPHYDYHLSRAIEEIRLALAGVREVQTRAVIHWRNNGH